MTNWISWPLVIAIAIVASAFVFRKLRAAAQPLRLQLAEKGERLLGDPNLPKHLAPFVRYLLDGAFGGRWQLICAALFLPFFPLTVALDRKEFEAFKEHFTIPHSETKVLFDEVDKLHDRITFANHPLLSMLIELEIVLIVPFAIVVFSIFRGQVPANANAQDVKTFIESRDQMPKPRLHAAA